ncbi:sugar transferase [Geomonas sp. Red32]|uniref:sugar transferase n=1 Tax=Geomonas sp. Red32 TaxID=2912856 RepID=UPI00202CF56C|nr:sugar transferase [Geomonas sp. Red32]MCM0083589.1 sugar transferase [Geomonas sp. Red32]
MLKEQASVIRKANIVTDAAIIVTAFLTAYDLRVKMGELRDLDEYSWLLLAIIPIWLILLDRFGLYASQRINSLWNIFVSLIKVTACGGILSAALIYFLEPRGYSRGFFGTFLILSFLMLLAEQYFVRLLLRLFRLEGYNVRNLLLVGTGESARRILTILEDKKEWGFKVVGFVHTQPNYSHRTLLGHPVVGPLTRLVEICKDNPVDEVIFCDSKEEARFEIAAYIADLHEMGITARTVLNLFYRFEGKKELTMLQNEVPLLTFRSVSADANQLFFKRCLDLAGASVGLAITAVLFPFIALAIKLESPGPLFFGQTRVRENGRTFTCWKFRSMFIDAEERKKELMHLNEMEGAIFKIKNDPRVTRVGAFIRKTSLDELPQFWNVLKGEMSLVGTRPPTPAEVANYQNWQRKRICMKPGITGLWQVSGRNSINDFDEVVRLDLEYIDTWSFATDLRLILRTLKVVIFREGAC